MTRQNPNLRSLNRLTPRSRYNANFLAKLQEALKSDPEADISKHISSYSAERLMKLRGASTRTQLASHSQRVAETLQHIPEPDGNLSILSPLHPKVKNLLRFNSSLSGTAEIVSVFGQLLQHGRVLHQVHSKWVVKLADSVVVKFAPGLDISEYQTMCYLWSRRENIPMPEPLGVVSIGDCNYLFMSFIEGECLARLWPSLPPEMKCSIRTQLGEILRCLRKMPLPSKYLGSGDPPLCKDMRRFVRTSTGSISTELEFNKFLTSASRELNPVFSDMCASALHTNHEIVMTHSDIRPQNIIVLHTAPDCITIAGLIDWELSGAYPEYWEFVKAFAGVNSDLSDWFSYLPIDIIGEYSNELRQDWFISRLVV